MKKIIINSLEFPFDVGCGLLKLKYTECPFPELDDFWDEIVPLTFLDIMQLTNLEERRVGILCLGIDRLVQQINPELINRQEIPKTTMWVGADGNLINKDFRDVYELYEVSGKMLSNNLPQWQEIPNSYFVKCKDTSTDRDYLLWVDPRRVYETNKDAIHATLNRKYNWVNVDEIPHLINAVMTIAWTIQTNVPINGIQEIIRQGDCILIKPKTTARLDTPRHLTEHEYRTLLTAES